MTEDDAQQVVVQTCRRTAALRAQEKLLASRAIKPVVWQVEWMLFNGEDAEGLIDAMYEELMHIRNDATERLRALGVEIPVALAAATVGEAQ